MFSKPLQSWKHHPELSHWKMIARIWPGMTYGIGAFLVFAAFDQARLAIYGPAYHGPPGGEHLHGKGKHGHGEHGEHGEHGDVHLDSGEHPENGQNGEH
ncbi:hypothetical protein NDN08_008174 [Rhodosorus marinus]|uniref:NADH dehydrogenase [ubiquinone] 1 beta subcomplex subunit 3 n=1 Tax=Rhodosorus marinus TaxID=101924 RepID=A0AAV8V1B3_9RHOD|nr:hypothetical protein NDN08_008174 [Rhodosorus marinus]